MASGAQPLMTCKELVELVTDYLEEALPIGQRERFDEHIALCAMCRAHMQQLSVTLVELGTLTDDDVDPEFLAEMQQRFRDWRSRS